MSAQLIKDADYGDSVDAIKPAGNAYNLTEDMLGVDLPIWAKAIYLPATMSIGIVGARDKRTAPVPVTFTDHAAGYLQMEVRQIHAPSTDFDPTGILILHDNKTKDGEEVPGES